VSTFHFDVEQRTPEWDALRAGKLTASVGKKLVTPTGKPSVQYKAEIARIIAEARGLQPPEFIKPTWWMERGVNLEPEALAWFEVETDLTVEAIGFVESTNGLVGASPDGLIKCYDGDQFLWIPLELKCPKPSTHIQWLLGGCVPTDHIAQVHFQIALCEAPYGYFCSYNPEVAPLIVRVDRNEYTELMEKKMGEYCIEFESAMKYITGEE
jgi:hypothetical protein